MHNPVGWFEIPVEDMARAVRFYETVFETKLHRQQEIGGVQMSWFPMEDGATGCPGALVVGEVYRPGRECTGTVVYFTAPDIKAACARVVQAGGRVIVPKKDIGQYGHIAWIEDTEGNTFGLHARK